MEKSKNRNLKMFEMLQEYSPKKELGERLKEPTEETFTTEQIVRIAIRIFKSETKTLKAKGYELTKI